MKIKCTKSLLMVMQYRAVCSKINYRMKYFGHEIFVIDCSFFVFLPRAGCELVGLWQMFSDTMVALLATLNGFSMFMQVCQYHTHTCTCSSRLDFLSLPVNNVETEACLIKL